MNVLSAEELELSLLYAELADPVTEEERREEIRAYLSVKNKS